MIRDEGCGLIPKGESVSEGVGLTMPEKDELKLAIGLGSPLTVQVEGMEEKVKATLVGMEPPVFLMVRMQIASTFRDQIDKGTMLIVRYVFMGDIYGFQSKYIDSITHPFQVTFLSYPEYIESLNLRSAHRVNCYIPALVNLHDKELRGVVSDMSTKGVRLTLFTKIHEFPESRINDFIYLSFHLPGIEGVQRFKGKIKNISGDAESLSFGVEFIALDTKAVGLIDRYIKDIRGDADL
jgi:hypothetical protein